MLVARAVAAAAARRCCAAASLPPPLPPRRPTTTNRAPFFPLAPGGIGGISTSAVAMASQKEAAAGAGAAAGAPPSPSPEVLAVLVTAPDAATAQKLADAAVGERLAACANVFLGGGAGGTGVAVQSTYWWKGELCRAEPETLLLLKAPAKNLPRLVARLRELHPYDEPGISALPVVGGSESYLRWVVDEATGGGGGGGAGGSGAGAAE